MAEVQKLNTWVKLLKKYSTTSRGITSKSSLKLKYLYFKNKSTSTMKQISLGIHPTNLHIKKKTVLEYRFCPDLFNMCLMNNIFAEILNPQAFYKFVDLRHELLHK